MLGLSSQLQSWLGDPYTGVWVITLVGALLMAGPMLLIGTQVGAEDSSVQCLIYTSEIDFGPEIDRGKKLCEGPKKKL